MLHYALTRTQSQRVNEVSMHSPRQEQSLHTGVNVGGGFATLSSGLSYCALCSSLAILREGLERKIMRLE